VSSVLRSKASAKYIGLENVSGCDRAVECTRRSTRRELHAVKKLREQHVELAGPRLALRS